MIPFPFPFNVYLPAAALACLATAVSLPLWRRIASRYGLMDEPGGRKLHAAPTPLAGGFALLTGFAAPVLLLFLLFGILLQGVMSFSPGQLSKASYLLLGDGLSHRLFPLAGIALGAVGMFILGWVDDHKELSAGGKFMGQLALAAIVAASGVRVTLFLPSPVLSYTITILWILTVTNAFNLLDNMNGLSAGVGLIASWCFAWSAAIQGQYLAAASGWIVFGALLGFLPFNFPRAVVFLGDAGSHLLGYTLSILAILPDFYTAESGAVTEVLDPLLILMVPLADLGWVVSYRLYHGKPIYIGDRNHLSHRLVEKGNSPVRAVLLLWLLGAAGGALAFLS